MVYDLRSSRAVAEYIQEKGGVPVRERVGHSFMKATIRQREGIFGGELAGHYYFRDHFYADCALLSAVEVLNLLWEKGEPLSRARPAAAPLRQEPGDQLRRGGQAGQDGRASPSATPTPRSTTSTASPSAIPTGGRTSAPRTPSPILRLVLEAKTPEELARRKAELIAILGEPEE